MYPPIKPHGRQPATLNREGVRGIVRELIRPVGIVMSGILIFIAATGFGVWAAAVNPHFSVSVRLQPETGHRVCAKGPYRLVRHPGYAGLIFGALAVPLVLGSWWALIPAGEMTVLAIFRTAMEDRTLKRELLGYTEYTRLTRYRLMPLLW